MKISRVIAAGILFFAPVLSQNLSLKLAKDLPDVDSRALADVIVQFTTPASEDEHRNIANLGGHRKLDLALINSAVYNLPAAALPALSRLRNLEYISPDRELMRHTRLRSDNRRFLRRVPSRPRRHGRRNRDHRQRDPGES